MRLSVVIVSYNVYHFLDNCLRSVRQAMRNIDGEIIVVDNASVDQTPELVRQHFPEVNIIANTDNRGFAVANNQGIRASKGDFILILNPDTVIGEETLGVCLNFFDQHPNAGAVGVKMLDGSGRFLPESKRGLPTLRASFMKMSGLYRLFPRSAVWNSYYQGHIREDEIAETEILTGAFMMVRRAAMEATGGFDEDFFMYGEDIDLSYRIKKAGYSVWYLPDTHIIHYKGESTRKTTVNYIMTFYRAMLIFAQKHPEFQTQRLLIYPAIYLHGFLQVVRQAVSRWWPALTDGLLWAGSLWVVSNLWARFYFGDPHYFGHTFYSINLPIYVVIMVLSLILNGAYDWPFDKKATWRGFIYGWIIMMIVYAFLPADLRSSRMIIIAGALVFLVMLWITRSVLPIWPASRNKTGEWRKAIIVAGEAEAGRIKELINRSKDHIEVVGVVQPEEKAPAGSLGHVGQLEDIIRVHQVEEIIFSAQDVPFGTFTAAMTRLGPSLRYMLAASSTMNIVGSMSRDTEGESYAIRVHFNLSHPAARRSKRILDVAAAVLMLVSIPIWWLIVPKPVNVLRHIVQVFTGRKTWVGYHPADTFSKALPPLRPGVVFPAWPEEGADATRKLQHIHYVYARDYHWTTDISILLSQFRKTGQPYPDHG